MIVVSFLRTLTRRPGRTGLALGGIAVSAALLLDMTMLARGLSVSFGELVGESGYALRVTPRGSLPFDTEAGIAEAERVRERIAGMEGVGAVAPVLGAQLFPLRDGEAAAAVFTSGIDPRAQFMYRLLEGADPAAGEVLVSAPMASSLGIGPGDTLLLAGGADVGVAGATRATAYRVSGIGEFPFDHAEQHSLAMNLHDLRRATGRAGEVSLFGVAVRPGTDEDALAREIEAAVPEASAYSTRALMAEMDRRLLYFRQLAGILGGIAVVVTSLLVSTIVTIGVRERFGEIATLRAIGVARGRILLAVVTEGLALGAAGAVAGLPLGLWLAGRLDRILLSFPGIPARMTFFSWDPGHALPTLAVVVAIGGAAGLLPALSALRSPLGGALREEAE
jgi:putative ABC transport system permease protein